MFFDRLTPNFERVRILAQWLAATGLVSAGQTLAIRFLYWVRPVAEGSTSEAILLGTADFCFYVMILASGASLALSFLYLITKNRWW